MHLLRRLASLALLAAAAFAPAAAPAAPLKIAYSEWPGWVAWEVAIQKGWIKQAGVEAEFLWFEYGPSMEAFTAGKVDAVMVTNGDALVTGANGAKNVIIMLTDYSNGNDQIIAKAGIKSVKELKGKKIGLEVGVVEHLLLLNALKKNGLSEADVTIVNTPTGQTPQVLASGLTNLFGASVDDTHVYFIGGGGTYEFDRVTRTTALGGVEADWESRKYYVSSKLTGLWPNGDDNTYVQTYRAGIAAYPSEFDEISAWLILDVQHINRRERELTVTPVMRLFYRNVLTEIGASFTGDFMLNFMIHL